MEEVPEVAAEVPEVVAEVAAEVVPEVAAEVVAEVAAEVVPEVVAEVVPEVPEVVAEVAAEVAAEVVPEVPEVVAEVAEPVFEGTEITPPEYVPPQTISLLDITNAMEVVQQKEAQDKQLLEAIGSLPFEGLKSSLIRWALLGYPNAHVIHSVVVTPPTTCSDGVVRDLSDYIVFCSGKPMYQHVEPLQARMTDITVSFANFGSFIGIVVTRPS